jgi:hypothetical protein
MLLMKRRARKLAFIHKMFEDGLVRVRNSEFIRAE